MGANNISQKPRSFFTLTQQYYNCCSQDFSVYFRDTDSQEDGELANIGFLKWSRSDSEDPTSVGDTLSVRVTAKPGGMGMVVPVDCKLIKIAQNWCNASGNDSDQDVQTYTCTPPHDSPSDWQFTLRDFWLINDSRYPLTVANHTFNRIASMGTLGDFSCTVTDSGSGYTGLATVTFSSPEIGNDTMEGTVKINNMTDEVVLVQVVYEGSGYTSLPTCVISDPPSGTTATATVQSSYAWDNEMSAGDHIILGFYSNDSFSPPPSVTGCITWFFESLDQEI